jgi:hypothetical protein
MMRFLIHYCKYSGCWGWEEERTWIMSCLDMNHLIFSLATPFKLESDRLEQGDEY